MISYGVLFLNLSLLTLVYLNHLPKFRLKWLNHLLNNLPIIYLNLLKLNHLLNDLPAI